MNEIPWTERLNAISIYPEMATAEDIQRMAAELIESMKPFCKICNDTGWNHHAQCKPSKRWPMGWKTIKCDCKAGKLKVSA